MAISESLKFPIVKIAAAAVIVFSTVGVGVMTGLIPATHSQNETPAPAEQSPVVQGQVKPATTEHAKVAATQPVREAAKAPVAQAPASVVEACANCGVIEAIKAVQVKGKASGAGAVGGGVLGAIVGSKFGKGHGKTLAEVAGAAGGAYAGHEIEKNANKKIQYVITVHMDDGTFRTVTMDNDNGFATGAKVRIVGESLVKS